MKIIKKRILESKNGFFLKKMMFVEWKNEGKKNKTL